MAMLRVRLHIMLVTLRKNGSRSLLAIAAVALGIASMMLVLALSAGAEAEMRAISEQFGKNLFGVSAVDVLAPPGRPPGWFASPRLKMEDVEALREQVSGLEAVVPVREVSLPARFGSLSMTTTVRGVTPDYLIVRSFAVEEGRTFDAAEEAGRARVALTGSYVAGKLNGGSSMIGETIWIGRVPFEVIGQLAKKGASLEGQNEDDQILIPLGTALSRVSNTDSLSRLVVQTRSEERISGAQTVTREILRATHHLDDDAKDDFRILSLIRPNEIRSRSSEFLRGLARIFAATTLAIGAAGVLAVTLLNVRERTAEIGLRLAVGARRRDILQLFVAEACGLSVCGGVAGIVAGTASVAMLERSLGWTMAIDARAILIPFALSVAVGLLFSVAPALKASSIAPVDALRDA